jgi:hypothetical protein
VVHQVRRIEPIRGLSRDERARVMEEIVYQADAFWNSPDRRLFDPRQMAWLELDPGRILDPLPSGGPPDPDETVRFTRYEPRLVELEAKLNRPGLVVLADAFYPGWTLEIDDRPAEVLRVNRMMRGAAVPSGTHRLAYRYRPLSFRLGLGLSGVGLVALLGGIAWARRQGEGDGSPSPSGGGTAG